MNRLLYFRFAGLFLRAAPTVYKYWQERRSAERDGNE